MSDTILFLCPHGAAKSVIAAAFFDQLASEQGLRMRASTGGTEPDAQVPSPVVEMLRAEGIDVGEHEPKLVTREAVMSAIRVVSLGCNPHHPTLSGVDVEQWDDVPAPSQDLAGASKVIRKHVEQLVRALKQTPVAR